MPINRLVLPLAILAGAFFFAPPASGDHSAPASTSESGKQANSKPPPKNSKAEQPKPNTKKESRMNERDREMDKRMKQQKAR